MVLQKWPREQWMGRRFAVRVYLVLRDSQGWLETVNGKENQVSLLHLLEYRLGLRRAMDLERD